MLIRYRIRYRFFVAFQRHERMSGSRPLFHSHSPRFFAFLRITPPESLVFLRKFGSLAECLRPTELPCPRISAGERKLKYPGPGFWRQPGIRGSNRTHLFFVLLRASVTPWCKGLVFGCDYVALRLVTTPSQ